MDEDKKDGPSPTERAALAFLLPTYKTPMLTADLLHAASGFGDYGDLPFVLLLNANDPFILTYREVVEAQRQKGLNCGYMIFDGTPYCGMVNRAAPIVNADHICVLDSTHLPRITDQPFAEGISRWVRSSVQPMRVGRFTDDGFYPVVSRKLIERLGYMFHPLCYGRTEAEAWLLSISAGIGVQSAIEGGKLIESRADGVEILGVSEEDDARWVEQTLDQTLDDEIERLDEYVLK